MGVFIISQLPTVTHCLPCMITCADQEKHDRSPVRSMRSQEKNKAGTCVQPEVADEEVATGKPGEPREEAGTAGSTADSPPETPSTADSASRPGEGPQGHPNNNDNDKNDNNNYYKDKYKNNDSNDNIRKTTIKTTINNDKNNDSNDNIHVSSPETRCAGVKVDDLWFIPPGSVCPSLRGCWMYDWRLVRPTEVGGSAASLDMLRG
jgi:hypothetical protein